MQEIVKLRKLNLKDAPLMFEWMQDKNVTSGLSNKFDNPSIGMCEAFIKNSLEDKKNLHLAITDENDEYKGTVSLKNIEASVAEFAIVLHASVMGKGYSSYAMKRIIEIGFNKFNLEYIYWNVKKDNKRAIRFYDKNKYERIDITKYKKVLQSAINNYGINNLNNYLWYIIKRS